MVAALRANSDTLVNPEEELRELIDERVRAVQTKDVTAIRARPADDVPADLGAGADRSRLRRGGAERVGAKVIVLRPSALGRTG